jgi:hypothetical protein
MPKDKRPDFVHAFEQAAREAWVAENTEAALSLEQQANALRHHIVMYPSLADAPIRND